MSLIRAGGITTLIMAVLTTAALTAFGQWFTANTMGEMIGHVLLWFPISLLVSVPVAFIIFPLLYTVLGIAGRPSGKLFALVGGVLATAMAGYALFRFRGYMAVSPSVTFLALPALVFGATFLGVIAGFLFERLARRAPQPIPSLSRGVSDMARPFMSDEPLPPPHPGDLKKPPV